MEYPEGCHFTFPLGTAYYDHAACAYRTLLRNILRRLLPKPLLHLEDFPSFGQATITTQPNRRILHLLCYVPEKRGTHMEIVEEPSIALDVKVQLRLDGLHPTALYLAPDRKSIPFTIHEGYAAFTIPVVKGYVMVVLEKA